MIMRWMISAVLLTSSSLALGQNQVSPTAKEIIHRSEQTTHIGFQRASDFDYCMTENNGNQIKTYAVFMIAGSDYEQLVAVNGIPLSAAEQQQQNAARKTEAERRNQETPEQRTNRVTKYEKEQDRNQTLLREMPKAFNFTLVGIGSKDGRETYVLDATRRNSYDPIDRQTRVLTGMQGTLWIDKETYGWVRAEAVVVHPVSIEGFLARVEKGTRFTMEERPFGDGIWLPTLFNIYAKARILFIFPKTSRDEYTFFHYVPRGSLTPDMCMAKPEPTTSRTDEPLRPER